LSTGPCKTAIMGRVGTFETTGSVLYENKIEKIVFFLNKARFTSEAHKSQTPGHPGN